MTPKNPFASEETVWQVVKVVLVKGGFIVSQSKEAVEFASGYGPPAGQSGVVQSQLSGKYRKLSYFKKSYLGGSWWIYL